MTLDEKRKVIEVLLCASDVAKRYIVADVADWIGAQIRVKTVAHGAWWEIDPSPYLWDEIQYELDSTEAAYRLIESSPTLRREWFGAQ